MALTPGTRFEHYEIGAAIGAGGMGEVYRARDLSLNRHVALKVLPDVFAADPDRLARFQREAQVLASLSHPNIASIHGLAESSGVRALVLELVEGPTLADRLRRGPIPLDEVLPLAQQIAAALEAAHDHGIVHRDLKPSNIKLPPDGGVKILDFGLARVRQTEGAEAALSHSPTMLAGSMPGMILGTAAYMSPEQAKGKEADRTADVWAFGCVLYEMLTGRAVFEGETVSEILANVLKTEPDWHRLPAETPDGIRRLFRRCLQKDRKLRFHDMADVRIEIDEAQREPRIEVPLPPSGTRRRPSLAWISALALAGMLAAVAIGWAVRPVPAAPEMRVEITTPPTTDPVSLAISPDGQKIVSVATSEGRSRLWLRSLVAVSARPLAGTDNATYPFWSPDGRSVGFFADAKLKRIDIDGESVQVLASAAPARGGAWNRNNVILFATTTGSPIWRISASGGEPAAVTRLEAPQQNTHRFPRFLPDGRHFLFYVTGRPESRGDYVGQLDGLQTRRVLDADGPAAYASTGHLLFVRQGTLFAQRFDPNRLTLSGNAFGVAERVATDGQLAIAVSASLAGPIVYRAGSTGGQRQLVWFDRSGKEIEKVGEPDNASALNPSMSPDGRRVALTRTVNGISNTWLLETGRGVLSRFISDTATNSFPIWSPDGSRIVFGSGRKGVFDLYQKSVSGEASEELLLSTSQNKAASDWSSDGRFLLYRSVDPAMSFDIWAMPLEGSRQPFPVVRTNFEERDAQFSPDGKWIAFQSNESGRVEVYVQPFPGPGGRERISTSGGAQVRWRRDGKELFYIGLDGRLMAVAIRLAPDGKAVEVAAPVPLFATHVGGAVQSNYRQQYTVSPDGLRFLMNTVTEEARTSPITVILNWLATS